MSLAIINSTDPAARRSRTQSGDHPSAHLFMKNNDASEMFGILLGFGGAVGWAMNIIKIAGSDFSHLNGELVIRVIGVPMAPIGAVMGYVP